METRNDIELIKEISKLNGTVSISYLDPELYSPGKVYTVSIYSLWCDSTGDGQHRDLYQAIQTALRNFIKSCKIELVTTCEKEEKSQFKKWIKRFEDLTLAIRNL